MPLVWIVSASGLTASLPVSIAFGPAVHGAYTKTEAVWFDRQPYEAVRGDQ